MRSIITLILLSITFSAFSQVSEPYCTWEDANGQYHIARVNPATGAITSINSVSGMIGIVVPNTSVFKPTTGEYMCLALFGSGVSWLRFNVDLGAAVGTMPVSENWVGITYHCKNDTIYALREDNSSYELVWIDPIASVANPIATIPGVNAHTGSSFSIDPDADTYTFVGFAGPGIVIVQLDLNTGAIVSQNPFPYNIPGQYFNCNDNKIWGLLEDQQNMAYHLTEVQPSTGMAIPTYLLNGVTPGFISEGATFNGARNQFTFRGFDSGNNATIFAVDGSTGTITNSFAMSERIAGLEDSICCSCPLPVADFVLQNNAPVVDFTDQSYGSPSMMVWDFGDGDTSHTANPTHTYAQDGTYQVCLTITNKCGDSTFCDSVTISTVSQLPAWEQSLSVSPNPVNDQLHIKLPLSTIVGYKIELNTLSGSNILARTSEGSCYLDTHALAPGIYLLTISDGVSKVSQKVTIYH